MRHLKAAVFYGLSAFAWQACGDDGEPQRPDVPDSVIFDATPSDTTGPWDRDTTQTPDPQPEVTPDPTDTTSPVEEDETPPYVVEVTPQDGARHVSLSQPLEIKVVFNEKVDLLRVAGQPSPIELYDWQNRLIEGEIIDQADGKTAIWRLPHNVNQQQRMQYASTYTVRVSARVVRDAAGNRMETSHESRFTTEGYPEGEFYQGLAAQYAPRIITRSTAGAPVQSQVPTKFDADGDWDLSNNRSWLLSNATSKIVPAVYYAVSETMSHYFIYYMYYFPYVNHVDEVSRTGNALPGVLTVVEKESADTEQRPVAAYTFFRDGPDEEQFAFFTTEGGLKDDLSLSVQATSAEEEIFPEGRFESFITENSNRSCNWNWSQSGNNSHCRIPASVREGRKLVFEYKPHGPDEFKKEAGAWPNDMAEIDGAPESLGYALISIFEGDQLWSRRAETGGNSVFQGDKDFEYKPGDFRPGDPNLKLNYAFVQSYPGADYVAQGRPVWAMDFLPLSAGSGTSCHGTINRGDFGLDPVWYMTKRHTCADNGEPPAILSGTYCFNGFLGVDRRGRDQNCTHMRAEID